MNLPTGWIRISLEEVASVQTGVAKNDSLEGNLIDVDYLRVANVQDGYVDLSEMKKIKIAIEKVKRYLLQNGDVLLTEGGDFDKLGRGTVWLGQISPCIHQNHVFVARPDKTKLTPEFLSAQTGSDYGKKYFQSCSKQSTNLASINSSQLKAFPVILPPLPEQMAIADLLSTWDAAIEKTEWLIKAKEKQFQWLLNELITKPRKSGKWKEVRLGDVAMMSSGGTPKSSVPEYYDGDILWVSIKDITQQGMFINDTERKLTALGLKNSSAKIFPKGCVLYAMYASIGEVSITNCDVSTSQAILGIQPNDCLNNHFLYHFLVSLKEKIKLQGQSGTQSNLNAQMVKDFRLPLPSIKEQNRIVMHLEICKQEMQLLTFLANKYKTQKRGLMQKLLNGQWRVKEFK